MVKLSLLNGTALRSAAFVGLALLAVPAAAQEATQTAPTPEATAPEAAPQDAASDSDTILVTGSRIRRPNLDSPVPVTTLQGEEFFQTGRTSVGDTLNDLPALRSTFSQSNSTRFLGTAGLSLLDLRGLGTQRTLVLVNGRRHVAGDILNTAASTDINTIPTDLIERVDVVTGGSSAVYGSDALAGVVNFVLKDHFEGIEARGQAGASTYGDAGSYYGSLLAGKNFADGRGNIAVNLEYAHQNDFYASDRTYTSRNNTWVTVDSDPAGTANGSDGVPDTAFFKDLRSGTYSNGGTFLLCCRTGGGNGIAYQPYIFQANGNLAPQTGQITPALSFTPSYVGGNGDNFKDGTQLGLMPKLDRYSANLIGHFEISSAFVPFIEATYTRTDSFGSASGPFFTSATGSPREKFFSDNPYLTTQARSILRQQDSYDANCSYVTGGDGIPDADRGQCGIGIYKNAVDLTNRTEKARRETFRAVLGVRGDLADNLNYEISANYGEFKEHTEIRGNVNLQRYLLSIDAVDQGLYQNGVANGNIVCRSKIDPSAAVAFEGANNAAFAQSRLAADVAACVPVNLFGTATVTQAARDYMLQSSFADGKITQFVASGFISGDTSKFFNLPGGPVGFSVGGEYRRETAYYKEDDVTANALTFYNAIPEFKPPSFEVKEAFAELRLPILKDVPFFQELTVSGAARVADYKGATGTVFAYNGGVEWAPVRSLRLRANYARSVRAPNLSDLYTPLGQNFDTVYDPCDTVHIGAGSSTRAANCHADGVPNTYNFQYRASIGYLSGGNPNLEAEKSSSYTIGGVFQPTFAKGFSLTVDYYHIDVKNVITSPSAQQVLNACYDAANLSNQYCALFARNTSGGAGPAGEVNGQILNNSLNLVPLNYAKLAVSGIDFDLGFERSFDGFGRVSLHGIYTHAITNNNYLDPTDPGRYNRQLGELGDPIDAFNINAAIESGPFTLGYEFRYIGKMVPGNWEDAHSVQGRAPQNADAFPIEYYDAVMYHNVRGEINVNKQFSMYLGVDNVFNKLPPYYLTGAGAGSGIYNNLGRFFYAGFKAKF
ncbi:TonB-dependent receptor [Sphingomonas sp. R-74633]|uniref:TonB-dependent receptor domain-containing protein n=1 Tax=Sphingomonas sp. R-74633 TaxID=2751188 RepID=UPI0015D3EC3A|nr:TonB-dependent receptor [Sphingomonas sp. R-74633]NYT39590.1 TonB-dependent receptor [Sphingomonas sp. R-74633]